MHHTHLPTHIGFIMDGNRTWATNRGLPKLEGHRSGYANAKKVIEFCLNAGIPYCSFWALSDDNIRERSPEEVAYLFRLLTAGILDIARDAHKKNIRIVCIGDRTLLPEKCQENMAKAEEKTKNNTAMTAIIAIGYGGQEEIVRATQKIILAGLDPATLSKEIFSSYIESATYPPPDISVRSGGHKRHSGYLLWLAQYSEYYFSELNWPDFSGEELDKVLAQYALSKRKFGK